MQIIKKHQNIVDFTVQHAGDLSALFATAAANGVSITGDVEPGTALIVEVVNAKTAQKFIVRGIDITSDPMIETALPGGIGAMQIGSTFKVA